MDPNESGGVHMETKAQLEAPLTGEVRELSVDDKTQTRQQVQEKLQSPGDIHNGE